MIALPPSEAGALKVTLACLFPEVATPIVGAPGTVAAAPPPGITLLETLEAVPVPRALAAVTVKVYETPLVKPVTVIGLPAAMAVLPPGLEVAVYSVIALPFEEGAVKLTVA